MSAFLTELVLLDVDGEQWEVYERLRYDSDLLKALVEVEKGRRTDLASIPALAWWLIPKTGKWDAPAVIHDELYTTGEFPKATADLVLLEAMRAKGVPEWRAQAIYRAVQWFGGRAWNAHRKDDAAHLPAV